MQEDKSGRNKRRAQQTKQLHIPLNTFKDFLNSALKFAFPEQYSSFSQEQKQQFWKNQLQRLIGQKEKICYLLPDAISQDEIGFGLKMLQKYNTQNLLDYEYESLFLGNKKQLLVFIKCGQMDSYLKKYKLPKPYENGIKNIEKLCQPIFQTKIQRNIAISLKDKEKIEKLNKQMSVHEQKFNKQFQKLKILIVQIFEHFKSLTKRTIINLVTIRQSLYQRLKKIADDHDLFISPRFPDIENDEYVDVEITKKTQFDLYFDTQNLNEDEDDGANFSDDDKSSVVSDLSSEDRQLQELNKVKPPMGVYSISFEKYQNKSLFLRVVFEFSRDTHKHPKFLQYSKDASNFVLRQQIEDSSKDFILEVPIQKGGHLCYYMRTKNQAGYSQVKNFNYFLNVDMKLDLISDGKLFMIGQSKHLIPQSHSRKQGNFTYITLSTVDFSISSTRTIICDMNGNSADWGINKGSNKNSQQIVQTNQYFNLIDNSKNIYIEEPFVRLEAQHRIIKTSCGRGYGMLLDAFGKVWVFGKNTCGELGIKEDISEEDTLPLKFFQHNKIFITYIKATQYSASFAIDSKGTLYKWGANQLLLTNEPIYDRFNAIMNYSVPNFLEEQWTPLPVKKHFQNQKIIQVECGNEFYLMLNNEGTLYGWGQCRNLGKGVMLDGRDQQIESICNDVQIMQNVGKVSAGKDHAIVVTKDQKILGWGKLQYISNVKKQFSLLPVDLTEQFGLISQEDYLICGPNYVCLYNKSEGKIKIFGEGNTFDKKQYQVKGQIRKIECGQKVIGFLIENDKKKQLI